MSNDPRNQDSRGQNDQRNTQPSQVSRFEQGGQGDPRNAQPRFEPDLRGQIDTRTAQPSLAASKFEITPALIGVAIDAILRLLEFISRVRNNNAVTAAWTPVQRAEVDQKWFDLKNTPAWNL